MLNCAYVFLSAPLSDGGRAGQAEREANRSRLVGSIAKLSRAGIRVFVPQWTFPLFGEPYELTDDRIMDLCFAWIADRSCAAVIWEPRWGASPGVKAEIEYAGKLDRPIWTVSECLGLWPTVLREREAEAQVVI